MLSLCSLWRLKRFFQKKNVFFFPLSLKVAIHYYGRLAAKQGWRFDSTYEHKDAMGEPVPFVFVVGSGKVRLKAPTIFLSEVKGCI